MYSLFVALVLGIDLKVNAVARQQVMSQFQTSDLALAQEIALDTDSQLSSAIQALEQLSRLRVIRTGRVGSMPGAFRAFKSARRDLDLVYWLTPDSHLRVSVPTDFRTLGAAFSNQKLFRHAVAQRGTVRPVIEDGIVDLTTFNAVLTILLPIHAHGHLTGVLGANLKLDDLNQSFSPVVASQVQHHQHVRISILDDAGRLIGTDELERLLQPAAATLPGAQAALRGRAATRVAADSRGERWLYTAVPVRSAHWAVVVQRSETDALSAVSAFQRWVTIAAALFALGGLLFWLVLLLRVVRPLRQLARYYLSRPVGGLLARPRLPLTGRLDEVGALARSLDRLDHDVEMQLAELHTLLETSNAVVTSLDPIAVGRTIIREVRRLVDIQAAAVFVPDDDGVFRVLVSEGWEEGYDAATGIHLDDLSLPPALALRVGRPVQRVAGDDEPFPASSARAGFQVMLSIPIISRRVGGVVLVVHRARAQRFSEQEVELLLTFANYATLAWEHAVLYERSDERLREVARENEKLYRDATAEKQTLAAIMSSMNDGLILTSVDGQVLYANPSAGVMLGRSKEDLAGAHIDRIYDMLRGLAHDPDDWDAALGEARSAGRTSWLLETDRDGRYQAINLRVFDVHDDGNHIIGRGLILGDVTREREVDQFKTTLLGAVGHELRTPLATIKGYASTLLQNDVAWPPDDQTHFLRTISGEADRLAQLVNNILDLSRSDAGLLPLHRVSCRLDDLIGGAVARLPMPVQDLSLDIPPWLPSVLVDRARVEVVVQNLLTNALSYGNGRVQISAGQRENMIVVCVRDNGPGIRPDELPRIFDRFYRASAGTNRSGGTGLGLAICRAFIHAHRGEIWAESGDTGTTISFSLPVDTSSPGISRRHREHLPASTVSGAT